ncbi:MAG: hypothetical protein ACRC20_16940 [Segniliparus sp.]|uniref:2OG-Fe(II)-dependent halogenase WelO5 family protein n=1 Tax=Segniliparus sp. TaxID=2804064 RepID=UPI003F3BBD28
MTSTLSRPPLTGKIISEGFSFIESGVDDINAEAIRSIILDGDHNGAVVYVIRNSFSEQTGAAIVEEFDRILERTQGGSRTNDSYVRTQQIGSTQFAKTGREYALDHASRAPELLGLLDSVSEEELETVFRTGLVEKVLGSAGVTFRASRYKNLSAGFATFRRWLDNGEMSLMPHDDSAQLKYAARDSFEIASVPHVVSYNAAIQSSASGGLLSVWNLSPDDEYRAHFGVVETGYPYPVDVVVEIESIRLELRVGDVYFLNSSFIHGVTSVAAGQRLTAGRFIGRVSADAAVYWT